MSCLLQLPSCCVDTWSVEMLALDLGHQFLEQQRLGGRPAADGVCSFDCFISYCVQADVLAAEALFDRLVSLGFRPYIDTKFFFVARYAKGQSSPLPSATDSMCCFCHLPTCSLR